MSSGPFRFVHASDFHLEVPVQGLMEVPDRLREALLDAPYRAAQSVFDTARQENADFVLLVGDVVDLAASGPRALVFLLDQFERLGERNISVYWAGGRVDEPEDWPATVPLPPNVHVFPTGRVQEIVHERDGRPLARIVGVSRSRRSRTSVDAFQADPAGLFTIGACHGPIDISALDKQRVPYLALGGQHARRTLATAPLVAHFPGAPQGRTRQEAGAHGCTVVDVDDAGRCRTRLEVTDAVRWVHERIVLPRNCDRTQLESLLRERMQSVLESVTGRTLLVAWTIGGTGALVHDLRRGTLATELLKSLRDQFGQTTNPAWSVSLVPEAADALPRDWYDQETILGEFLRLVRQHEGEPDLPLNLETYLSERHLSGEIASAVSMEKRETRDRVLREVALLGADLLGGEWSSAAAAKETQR